MKKCIATIIGLSMLPLSGSFAEEVSFATPVEQPAAATDVRSLVLQALGEEPTDGAVEEVVEQPAATVTAIEAQPLVDTQAAIIDQTIRETLHNGSFNNLLHNDLREVAKFDTAILDTSGNIIRDHIRGTSTHILKNLREDAAPFAGQAGVVFYMNNIQKRNDRRDLICQTKTNEQMPCYQIPPKENNGPIILEKLDNDNGLTALGPIGSKIETSTGEVYDIADPRAHRRQNVILSVSYERIYQPEVDQPIYDIDLLLFFHSASTGYMFRYINVTADWTKKSGDLMGLRMNRVLREVPLSATKFKVHAELASQKVILEDSTNNIIKVIPITAGAIDSRALKSPDSVSSMTLLLPGTKKAIKYKDFELSESVLIKRTEWPSNTNSATRTKPSYYKGRPFIGIIDKSLISKGADGNLVTNQNSGKPIYSSGYRQIGFHYQITDRELERGFESHGCMRMQDHDLYMVDSIVNAGPKTMVPIEVKMALNNFHNLDSIYKRPHNYKKVVYTDTKDSPDTILCKNKAPYPVRYFQTRQGQDLHTAADRDCLTKTSKVNANLDDVVDALTGQSNDIISTLSASGIEHTPIKKRLQILNLKDNAPYISYLQPESLGQVSTFIDALDQQGQIDLIDQIRECEQDTLCEQAANQQGNAILNGHTLKWSRLRVDFVKIRTPRRQRPDLRKNRRIYNNNCAGKKLGQERIGNCQEYADYFNTALKNYGISIGLQ